jgi:hypothetical protein
LTALTHAKKNEDLEWIQGVSAHFRANVIWNTLSGKGKEEEVKKVMTASRGDGLGAARARCRSRTCPLSSQRFEVRDEKQKARAGGPFLTPETSMAGSNN